MDSDLPRADAVREEAPLALFAPDELNDQRCTVDGCPGLRPAGDRSSVAECAIDRARSSGDPIPRPDGCLNSSRKIPIPY